MILHELSEHGCTLNPYNQKQQWFTSNLHSLSDMIRYYGNDFTRIRNYLKTVYHETLDDHTLFMKSPIPHSNNIHDLYELTKHFGTRITVQGILSIFINVLDTLQCAQNANIYHLYVIMIIYLQ